MTRKLQTNPRKSASQERSRLTVDALLEATTRVLIKEGYDRASTNRIAEVAGVSIGSLYQYFPSKEALVAAVIDRHTQEISEVTRNALVKAAARPIEVAAREFVSVAIDGHRVIPSCIASLRNRSHMLGDSKSSRLSSRRVMHWFEAISRHIEMRLMSPISISRPSS